MTRKMLKEERKLLPDCYLDNLERDATGYLLELSEEEWEDADIEELDLHKFAAHVIGLIRDARKARSVVTRADDVNELVDLLRRTTEAGLDYIGQILAIQKYLKGGRE